MSFSSKYSDDIRILHLDSNQLVEDKCLLHSYCNAWSTAFNRSNFHERLKWILSFPSASALLLNTNDEVLGGLNAHSWSSSSYRLFNNLFVLPGVSSKPLSLNLINGLIGTLNSQAIGLPNDLARIP